MWCAAPEAGQSSLLAVVSVHRVCMVGASHSHQCCAGPVVRVCRQRTGQECLPRLACCWAFGLEPQGGPTHLLFLPGGLQPAVNTLYAVRWWCAIHTTHVSATHPKPCCHHLDRSSDHNHHMLCEPVLYRHLQCKARAWLAALSLCVWVVLQCCSPGPSLDRRAPSPSCWSTLLVNQAWRRFLHPIPACPL
jgi:hypothetical protein